MRLSIDGLQSDVARALVAKGAPQAEVPFMVCLGVVSNAVYLEGEIDAVSFGWGRFCVLG